MIDEPMNTIYSGCMNEDLLALEEKLSHLLELFHDLKQENSQLKEELSAVKSSSEALQQKMTEASERIDKLMQSLP